MADGYARASGKVGVLLTTTGPGAVNALTSLGEAHADSSPVLLITSGPVESRVDADLGTLHEMRDQFSTLHSVCGQGCRVSSVEEIPAAIAAAFTRLQCYRPKPYVLEIPLDLFAAEAEFEIPESALPPLTAPYREDLEQAIDLIRVSTCPLIVAGGGAQNAAPEIARLAEQLQSPVALTSAGLGTFPADHPLFLGAAESAEDWVEKSDLVLAVGTRFSERIIRSWKTPPSRLIHLDIDQYVVGRHYRADAPLIGDARLGLQNLLSLLEDDRRDSDWSKEEIAAEREEQLSSEDTPFPQILRTLRQTLARDAIVANDMTMICYQARRLFPVYAPRTDSVWPRSWPQNSPTRTARSSPCAATAVFCSPPRNCPPSASSACPCRSFSSTTTASPPSAASRTASSRAATSPWTSTTPTSSSSPAASASVPPAPPRAPPCRMNWRKRYRQTCPP